MSFNIRERDLHIVWWDPRIDHGTPSKMISSVPWRISVREVHLKVSLSSELNIHLRINPGIVYKLWDENVIGRRERNNGNVCYMEIEIVAIVIDGSVKLTIPPDRHEYTHIRSRSVAFCRVFDLKIKWIYLIKIILKLWIVDEQKSSMYLYVKFNLDTNWFFPVENE